MLAYRIQTTYKMGVVRVMRPIFQHLAPNHNFGIGEAERFKFRVLTDTPESQ